ncbi:thioredoxin [Sulfolobus acidocaldarius]|uniref:Thioredoxin n=4 Tax=Sulfolobus acidocaldarius TaxID=2285 RepID=Q4J7V3_SULAC|nr:thioredoxin [Sulfolobus acidocaldarius]AAY81129.1 thioredoxin [Sulfolobus acidocaldarius DSM 639]AGE71739.1 thioredoxin [Sulfolobus acidocaldarius N8]AGE74012.1 thioredoxin [Sulfolobus acidocaldarius Ron12/I]ALU30058.1 thioredoxin [Sulfolobus acidocaldarius]ALU30748.1 thioredoxin [Sulfolobus acidocaldarius]
MSWSDEDTELEMLLNRKLVNVLRSNTEKNITKFPGGKIHHLTDKNFNEFLSSFKVSVVDFWAEWCPPCHLLSPIIEELSKDYKGVGFGKLNVDQYPEIATSYGVISLPTVLLFHEGKPVDYVLGAVPREVIEHKLRKFIGT